MKKTLLQNKNFLGQYLNSLNLKLDINNLSYLPRWVVLFLDIFIVFVSLISTYYLLYGIGLKFTQYDKFFVLFLFGFFNTFFFWVFKTYSGIIRHSSFVDAIKIFFSQFTTAIFMVVLNLTLLYHNLILNFFISVLK